MVCRAAVLLSISGAALWRAFASDVSKTQIAGNVPVTALVVLTGICALTLPV